MKNLENAKELDELEEKAVCGGTGPHCPENNPNDDPEADRKANEEFLNSLPDLFETPKFANPKFANPKFANPKFANPKNIEGE